LRRKILDERVGKTLNRAERRAQVMRHRVTKSVELGVDLLEPRRPLSHAILELGRALLQALAQSRAVERNGELRGNLVDDVLRVASERRRPARQRREPPEEHVI